MSSLPVLRQSAAELLALVVTDLFPGALIVQSIPTEFGFFCDVLATQPIDDYALPLIEEKMRGYVRQDIEVKTLDMMREVAANFLEHKGQTIRADAVRSASENIVNLIQIGDFHDYCPLPYITETREVESFKIYGVEPAICFIPEEGVVDVKRIHGVVAADKQALKKLVKSLQAGKKADHTRSSGERGVFSFHEEISSLSCVWEDRGVKVRRLLIQWWESEHVKQQFRQVSTPSLIKESLAGKAGVYDQFSDEDLPVFEVEDTQYVVVPTPAPSHMVLFGEKSRNSKDMPLRIAECAPLVSQGQKSNLWGAFDSAVAGADFAHIFCAPEHLEGEFISSLQFIDKFIKMFGFEYYWYFKGRGEKFAGTVNRWEKATNSVSSAFEKCGFAYESDPQETAFAGPVVEARLIDSCGREWKGPRVGLDFNSPDRMGLRYQGADGKTHVPLMIVRSLFGSFERFVALLLENGSINAAEAFLEQIKEKASP